MKAEYKFRYVQRLTPVKPAPQDLRSSRFGEVFALAYMGYAEYEYGAFEEFLRAMHWLNEPQDMRTFWEKHILRRPAPVSQLVYFRSKVAGVMVYGVFDSNKNTLDSVRKELINISRGRAYLKGSAFFPPREGDLVGPMPVTAWVEIKQNVIWSLHDLSHFGDWIKNSVEHFDTRSKQGAVA